MKRISITITLAESLLSIFRDSQAAPRPETTKIKVAPSVTVKDILIAQGINPLLVPMVFFGTGKKNERVDMNTPIKASGTLTLYGPLAGG